MRTSSLLFVLVMIGALAGCDRQDRLSNPDSTVAAPSAPAEGTAFLSVSDLSPDDGGTVTVAGSIALGDSTSLGSFRVRLAYDTGMLAYLDEVDPEAAAVARKRYGCLTPWQKEPST